MDKILMFLLIAYGISVAIFGLYYNYEYAQTHGFLAWLFFIIGCLIAIIFLVAEGRGGLNYLWVPFIGLMIFGAIKTLLQRW